jgi:hypothetical protein
LVLVPDARAQESFLDSGLRYSSHREAALATVMV